MCGINGFYNYSSVNISNPIENIKGMNAAIRHRGPDSTGVWSDSENAVFFGHQRLSIQDLSENGKQPMSSESGSTIVFNGEIYNYRSLKKHLPDYKFKSEGDTEVLLAIYESKGTECLQLLNGMFAFSIWDCKKRKLFIARDRLGIKPFYYTSVRGIFAFSSEIRSLLTLPWVRAELDENALYDFLTFNRVAPPKTVFKNIHKLHPGHAMIVGSNGIESDEPYWDVDYSSYASLSEDRLSELLISKLNESVNYRMVSDVPVGAFLSGGVDSSAIVSLMNRNQSSKIKTYSIGFENCNDYDERKHASGISDKFGTEHYEKIVKPGDFVEFIPKIADIYDEPLADATSIPMYFLSKLARDNGTTVVLTGDGADEELCGYRNWMRYIKLQPYYTAYTYLPKQIRRLIAGNYSSIGNSDAIQEILNRAVAGQELFWGGAGGFKESLKHAYLSEEYAMRMSNNNSYKLIESYRSDYHKIIKNNRKYSRVDWMSYLGIKYIVPNFYLHRADRIGMANSVEIRVPFMDHNFVNFALSIPPKLKVKGGIPKYLLKKSLEDVLPHKTLYRKKQGFCVPLKEWAEDIMVEHIDKNLSGFCSDTGLFNEQGIRNQIKYTKEGSQNYIFTLWNMYFLMNWFRRWMAY